LLVSEPSFASNKAAFAVVALSLFFPFDFTRTSYSGRSALMRGARSPIVNSGMG